MSTYRHYPGFTRRYVRSFLKNMGLPKKPKMEAMIFDALLSDVDEIRSINGEILMLEWHYGREGRVVVPEPSLSEWLQTVQLSRVQRLGLASSAQFPTGQTFPGQPVEGALVA